MTVDLEKAFDTADHQILSAKLDHYGIQGVSNDWFKLYLSNQNQYVSMNAYDSGFAAISCGVPQSSVLGPRSILSIDGKTPVAKERLNKFANCTEISFLRRNKII